MGIIAAMVSRFEARHDLEAKDAEIARKNEELARRDEELIQKDEEIARLRKLVEENENHSGSQT